MTLRELGARIRARRLEENLTQQQLADAVGASRWWVNRVETGQEFGASLGAVLRALDFLGLDLTIVRGSRRTAGSFDLDAVIADSRE